MGNPNGDPPKKMLESTRGHDELPTQNNAHKYSPEFPQDDHIFALFDPPQIRVAFNDPCNNGQIFPKNSGVMHRSRVFFMVRPGLSWALRSAAFGAFGCVFLRNAFFFNTLQGTNRSSSSSKMPFKGDMLYSF